MTFSWKRVNAIFVKDYKDFSRNMAVSIIIFFPPVLAALYSRMGTSSIESIYMIFNMGFAMVAAFVQSCLIAEEKEKNTLRGLMLSPATTAEILSGKSLLSFLLTLFSIVLSAIFFEYLPKNIGIIALAIILSSFFYIGLGTLLGLYAKSIMEASALVLPVIIVFSAGTFSKSLAEQYPVLKAANYLPNVQLLDIATKVEANAGGADVLSHFAIIAAWVIIISLLTVIIFRKRMVD
ncbi:ABC transporter permease [Siminovitchia sp. FSL H7-0308]|uniref:ABC-2 type transport system permease protein n=1 Tax=Siminovitchia thermophila TaxID=1245522 RepID=A0ABS2R7Q3_9BACI|nr:ABC transporter permease [Siminovitchia thermophila]MBM7715677.1 ABC-2 type transport system permease protein [Siminovitchia thermophila]